jgi:hypothetical protein
VRRLVLIALNVLDECGLLEQFRRAVVLEYDGMPGWISKLIALVES